MSPFSKELKWLKVKKGLIILSLVMLCTCFKSTLCDFRSNFSFIGPFEQIVNEKRILNENWKTKGKSDVLKHFVRLTSSQNNQEGYIWNEKQIDSNQFGLVLTFRISGKREFEYGHGIGLWITQHPSLVTGQNYGFTHNYYGMGIVLDSSGRFSNPYFHKDISIHFNAGEIQNQINHHHTGDLNPIGCSAKIRYYELHDHWNPIYNSTRIKVLVSKTNMSLYYDENNIGSWTLCWTGTIPLDPEWSKTSTIALSSSTSHDNIVDNHDILKLEFFDFIDDHHIAHSDTHSVIHNVGTEYEMWINTDSCGIDCKLAILQKQINDFHVNFEYKVRDLKEKSATTMDILQTKENDNQRKIEYLENYIAGKVQETVDRGIGIVGKNVQDIMNTNLHNTENPVFGGWKFPFLLLVLALCVATSIVYQKFVALKKSHLL